jgi:hypothetical protein
MNERIRELGEQADLLGEFTPTKITGRYVGYITEEQILKFAELIVRECAEVAQDFVTVENNKLVEKIHISPWHLQDKIKEHFGVDE